MSAAEPNQDLAAAYIVGVQRLRMPGDLFATLSTQVLTECDNPERHSFGNNYVDPRYRGERIDVTGLLDPIVKAYLCTVARKYILHMAGLNGIELASDFSVDFSFSWIIRFRQGDYLPIHHHTDELSGVVYIAIPGQLRDSGNIGGKIGFMFGQSKFSNLDFLGDRNVDPAEGDILIFPAWLQHTVYPFQGEGERIALAFNLRVQGMQEP